MIRREQAKDFYLSLSKEEKSELCKAIAEDIFFLDESLQNDILNLFDENVPEISEQIRKINSFTT